VNRFSLYSMLLAYVLSLPASAQTHVIYLKDGASIAGTPSPGKTQDEISITLSDKSKIDIHLTDVKEIAEYKGQDLTKSLTEDGPIPPPRDWRLSFLLGMQGLGSSSYTLVQQSGTSTSSDSGSPGFGFAVEAGYRKEKTHFGGSLLFSSYSYAYPSAIPSDSMQSIQLIPKYFHDLSERLTVGAGLGVGLVTLSLGSNSTNASGALITLDASKAAFGLSPRIFTEYEMNSRLKLLGEASYTLYHADFEGSVSTPGVTKTLTQTISRSWLTFSVGLVYRFSI
jgi:hypothetical protein